MIEVSSISFSYDSGTTFNFPNFRLEQGEQSLLLGNSGCGKTTLLHIIAGFTKPQAGEITISNQTIYSLSETARDKFRGNTIGFIFQKPLFIQSLSVKENILLAQHLGGAKDVLTIESILNELGLNSKLNSKISELSEGEKQRVNIARALINSPKLILADEPTSALDDDNCTNVINLLKRIAKEANATLLVVTHDNRLKEIFSKKIELV